MRRRSSDQRDRAALHASAVVGRASAVVGRASSTGEEPALGAVLGSAYIRGLQSERVAACAKHYVANSQEDRRNSVDSIIGERALHEVYYPAFEAAVRGGNISCVMCSYNGVDGRPICAQARPAVEG